MRDRFRYHQDSYWQPGPITEPRTTPNSEEEGRNSNSSNANKDDWNWPNAGAPWPLKRRRQHPMTFCDNRDARGKNSSIALITLKKSLIIIGKKMHNKNMKQTETFVVFCVCFQRCPLLRRHQKWKISRSQKTTGRRNKNRRLPHRLFNTSRCQTRRRTDVNNGYPVTEKGQPAIAVLIATKHNSSCMKLCPPTFSTI